MRYIEGVYSQTGSFFGSVYRKPQGVPTPVDPLLKSVSQTLSVIGEVAVSAHSIRQVEQVLNLSSEAVGRADFLVTSTLNLSSEVVVSAHSVRQVDQVLDLSSEAVVSVGQNRQIEDTLNLVQGVAYSLDSLALSRQIDDTLNLVQGVTYSLDLSRQVEDTLNLVQDATFSLEDPAVYSSQLLRHYNGTMDQFLNVAYDVSPSAANGTTILGGNTNISVFANEPALGNRPVIFMNGLDVGISIGSLPPDGRDFAFAVWAKWDVASANDRQVVSHGFGTNIPGKFVWNLTVNSLPNPSMQVTPATYSTGASQTDYHHYAVVSVANPNNGTEAIAKFYLDGVEVDEQIYTPGSAGVGATAAYWGCDLGTNNNFHGVTTDLIAANYLSPAQVAWLANPSNVIAAAPP